MSSTSMTPYIVFIVLLTVFPMLFFTSLWLFCNCQFVLLYLFTLVPTPSTTSNFSNEETKTGCRVHGLESTAEMLLCVHQHFVGCFSSWTWNIYFPTPLQLSEAMLQLLSMRYKMKQWKDPAQVFILSSLIPTQQQIGNHWLVESLLKECCPIVTWTLSRHLKRKESTFVK